MTTSRITVDGAHEVLKCLAHRCQWPAVKSRLFDLSVLAAKKDEEREDDHATIGRWALGLIDRVENRDPAAVWARLAAIAKGS